MAKTTWFIGGVKHKTKKSKASSTNAKATLSIDGKLTLTLPGTPFGSTDPEVEREPPLEATPVTFPTHIEREGQVWTEDKPPPNFQALFSKVLKPTDISQRHLEALNISTLPKCSITALVPDALDGSSYLEPAMAEPSTDSHEQAAKVQPEVARKRKDFDDRIAELKLDNDLVFRTLNKRVPAGPAGTKPPRIAFMRKFFEGLEGMSQYWDCSLDQYYDVYQVERGDEGDKCVKRQRLENGFSPRASPETQTSLGSERPLPIVATPPSHGRSEDEKDHHQDPANGQPERNEDTTEDPQRLIRSPSATPDLAIIRRYKGRRTGTGREMPDQYRTDTARAFVEGAVWAFRASLTFPRVMPLVQFNKLNLPVRQTAAAYRLPYDRMKARQGWQEGPILALQVRAETEFEDAGEEKGRLDGLREIAALLQLAQERRREGRKQVKPGEGQWWTTKPRWGGGDGGDAQNEIGNTDILAAAEELLSAAKEKTVIGKGMYHVNRNRPGRKTPAMLWKELKPGRCNWDPKTEYVAIGKDPSSEWDEVFLISSLNHHISILKLTIHGAYVDYLASATMPAASPEDPEWSRPKLQRTEWFNFFDVDQRIEAFSGLWGVMAYLTRDTGEVSATA